jgi:hypothetical protein
MQVNINARPKLNGNTTADFSCAAHLLLEATTTCRAAMNIIYRDVLHGRNYQTAQNGWNARMEDIATFQEMIKRIDVLVEYARTIYAAGYNETL